MIRVLELLKKHGFDDDTHMLAKLIAELVKEECAYLAEMEGDPLMAEKIRAMEIV